MKLFFIYLFAYLTSTACTSKVEVAPDNIRTTKKCTTAAALATAECAKITKELLVDLTTATTELTNRVSLPFVVKFSESVSDFTESDISVSGGAVGSFEGSGTDYKFSVTPSADGEVKVSIAKEVAEDANKNKNQASLIITRKFDGSRPSVVLATTSSTPTSVTPIPVTATFSEIVTDFTSADITVTNGTVAGFTGAEASYSFNVIPNGNGAVTITVADGLSIDAATNTNTASNVISVVYESAFPAVTLTSTATSSTNSSPIAVTVIFSKIVTGFVLGDVTVGNGTASAFAGSGTTYTFDVTPTINGAVTVDVAAGVAVDASANANTAAAQLSRIYDTVQPTVTAVTSTKTNGSYKVGEVIGITATFSESVTVTGTPTLTLETGGTDAVVSYTSGSPGTTLTFNYTVAANETSADLDYASTTALALAGGTIKDASLNNATLTLVSPSTSTGATIANGKAIVIDTTVPVITYTSISPTSPGTSQTPAVTLSLSEAGSTTSLGLFSENTCSSSIATAVTGTSGSNVVTTTSLTASSTTTIYAKVTDVAGNASVCTSMVSYVHDSVVPTVTAVTSTKTDGSYKVGEVIGITVTFSKSVTVTGTPTLTLETGGTDAVANYTSGSPGTVLTFNYTVAATHTSADLDYASTTALALAGGTIKDASLNDATLTLAAPSTSAGATIANGKAIVIDTTAPTVVFSSVSAGNPGSTLTPTILGTGSETSTVTLYLGADCSGAAASAATANTVFASPGVVLTTSVGSNTATAVRAVAVDTAGNASACTSLVSYTHDSVAPTVTAVTSTKTDGSYKVGEVIGITVTFSESVTVTGTPTLTLETGGTDAAVNYTSGSPGTVLTFNYTVAANETSADLDYASTTALALAGGTIRDASLNNATLTLVSPSTSTGATIANSKDIVIDTTVPVITYTSINPVSPGSSQTPVVTLSLSEAGSTTSLGLFSENTCSSSIATAVTGTLGSNVVTTTSLTANSTTTIYAKVTDVAGNASVCTIMVSYVHDNVVPTVTAVTSTKTDGSYKVGEVIGITVTFSKSVTVTGTPQITLETGTTDAVVNYTSGSPGTVLTFNYTVASTHTSSDLDYQSTTALALNSGTIQDASLNNATLTLVSPSTSAGATIANGKAIVIDTTVPVITYTSINPTTPGSSQTPAVTLSLSEAGSTTSLGLFSEIGCTSSIATAVTGASGSNAVTTTSLTANSTTTIYAKVTDVAGNASVCTSMVSYVHDSVVPTVTAVTSTKSDGSYKVGEVIGITVTFSKSVTVTGTPTLTLETGTTDAVVNYTSGSPGTVLTFNYTVASTHTSSDLDYQSTTALALNSGTIKDASLNDATLTLVAPSTSAGNTIANGKAIVIDTTAPAIAFSSISVSNPGSTLTPTLLGTADASTVTLYYDSSCVTAKSAGTANTTFASPGIVVNANVGSNTTTTIYGQAVDTALNASACTSLVTYNHDNVAPVVSVSAGVSSDTANGSYKLAGVIAIKVTFSEAVTVTGTPRLTLETGTTDAVVDYTSGSGSTVLVFNYTVAATHTSADLDYASTTALALNSGTIKDSALNAATLTLATVGAVNSLGANNNFVIDTTVPTITYTSISPASPGSSQTPAVTLSLSEASGTSGLGLYSESGCTTSIATAVTGTSGSNAVTTTSLTSGSTTTIYAKATDVAGNVSTCTSMVSYTHTAGSVESWTATTSTSAPAARDSHSAVWTGSKMIVWGGSGPTNTGGLYDPVTNSWSATTTTSAPLVRSDHSAVWTGSKMIVWGGNGENTGGLYDAVTNSWSATTTTSAPAARNYHSAVWTGSKMIVWGGYGPLSTGGLYDPVANSWSATTTTSPPTGRYFHVAVWTGSKMIVWGGSHSGGYYNTGGLYDPVANSWTATTTTSAAAARGDGFQAVWTGSKMIVWGGYGGSNLNTGGLYDPAADSWSATTTTGAPTARERCLAVWTGSKMIVWGGFDGGYYNTGGLYNPQANTWMSTTTTNAASARRSGSFSASAAVWTGSQMIVWGATSGNMPSNTGGVYTPPLASDTNTWTATTSTSAPTARYSHASTWTGSKMIVWGGLDGSSNFNTGGLYDPVANSWTATTTTSAPQGRYSHTDVWTGSKMIVWGGYAGGYLDTGGLYDPVTNSWTATTTTSAPTARQVSNAVWTGSKMIVWGGGGLNTGGLYDPVANSWTATTTTSAPSGRYSHSNVWTGSKMIVWGGWAGPSYFNDGGLYDPVANSWTATTTTNAPAGRWGNSAFWTGSKMIIWGGDYADIPTVNTGGLYDPQANSWTATTTTNAPTARYGHASVWTGSKMIVWGGWNDSSYHNTGGLYDPQANSWTETTTTSQPAARMDYNIFGAVWTGSQMIIWGGYNGTSYLNTGGLYTP